MGKVTGFKEFPRETIPYSDPMKRISGWKEFTVDGPEEHLRKQGARCMDCGVPFCQSATGCPIDNLIPEWNDLVYRGRWREALDRLHKTNNFPEFTGRAIQAQFWVFRQAVQRPDRDRQTGIPDQLSDRNIARVGANLFRFGIYS